MTNRTKYLITGTGPSAVLAAHMLHKKGIEDFLVVGPKPEFSSLKNSLIPFYVWLNSETYDIFNDLSKADEIDSISIKKADIGAYWRGEVTSDRTKEMIESYYKKTGKDYMSGGRKSFNYISADYSEAFYSMFALSSRERFKEDLVTSIDMESRYVELESGESIVYNVMLNSISLDMFLGICSYMPVNVGDLPCGNIFVLSVNADDIDIEELSGIDWDKNVYIYFPEEGYPWYRMSMKKSVDGNKYVFEFVNKIPENSPLLSNFVTDKSVAVVNKGIISTLKAEIIDSFANYLSVHHISRFSRWCSGWKISDTAQYISDRDFK